MIVTNATGKTVTIKCASGTGVAVPTGTIAYMFCDATDYYSAGPTTLASYVSTLTNAGDLVVYSTLATYVAAAIAAASISNTGQILNSVTDTTSGYNASKNTVGTESLLIYETQNPAANENQRISDRRLRRRLYFLGQV